MRLCSTFDWDRTVERPSLGFVVKAFFSCRVPNIQQRSKHLHIPLFAICEKWSPMHLTGDSTRLTFGPVQCIPSYAE